MIFATLQKLPKNVGNLGKIIVATGIELLPKVKKIPQSGHTGGREQDWPRTPSVVCPLFTKN